MGRRVVVTSLGVVSALGFSAKEIIGSLRSGKVAFRRPDFDLEVCTCPIEKPFDPKEFTGRYKNMRYLNRGAQLCAAAAMSAVKNGGINEEALARAGLFVGVGPNLDLSGECQEIKAGRMEDKSLAALWILRFLPNTPASAISDLAGIHGENATVSTACSASLQAIGEGFRKIKDGYLDLALAGGGDSRLSPGGILAYRKAQALWTGKSDCEEEFSPFDRSRKGFVPGEGGAFVLLEELDHARARGARIFGEIRGFGASMDGYNMTAPEPGGRWAEKAVRTALKEAGIEPSRVDLVSAHGTGTPLNDAMEADLISRLYGEHKPFVIALKSWIGHLAAACGAVELAVSLACMQANYLPEIRNLREPCRNDIHFVRTPTSSPFGAMVLENFGFGGQNSALVVKRWNGS
jgi:3-oxoacyl-[acyl-carrier-protein] synthase II